VKHRTHLPEQDAVAPSLGTEGTICCEVLQFLDPRQTPTISDIKDAQLAEPVIVGKQRTRYTPIGRKSPGPKGWAKKRADLRPA
jgi:hypothetical protein